MIIREEVKKYLHYCKFQKELDDKSIRAYRIDLEQFIVFMEGCGNDINKDTIIILEISSFQLDDFNQMKLDIALLLNIIDNHLDFYKTKKDYYLSKFKLTNNQTKHDCFIVNLDDYNTKK